MMAVQASEEMNHTYESHKQLMAEREKQMKQERELLAQRQALLEQERDREKRSQMVDKMWALGQPPPRTSKPPNPPLTAAELARDKQDHIARGHLPEPPTDVVSQAFAKKERTLNLRQSQDRLYKELRERQALEGWSEEEVRDALSRFANDKATITLPSTDEYLKSRNGGQAPKYQAADGAQLRSQYVAGLQSASVEFIESNYDTKTAGHLLSVFNQNLDKVSIPAYHNSVRNGNKDPVDMTSFLRSGITEHVPRERGNRSYNRRWSPAVYERSVNGWRNAEKSLARGMELSRDPNSKWYKPSGF
jgi:hypothetical protein